MFGKGRINISIQKTNYAPGDTISGNLALTSRKPVKARELSVSLIGEYMATQTRRLVRVPEDPRMSDAIRETQPKYDFETDTKTVRICDFKQQLDGEGEYTPGREYHFEIKISADAPTVEVKWYLLAKLNIPRGLDISKKVKLTISPAELSHRGGAGTLP